MLRLIFSRFAVSLSLSMLGLSVAAVGQASSTPDAAHASLISTAGPTFTVDERDLSKQLSLIVYGDMRFTDASNTTAANPVARRLLVAKIASEHPDAVQLTGDVPYQGGHASDYGVYAAETEGWRSQKLRVYPALGNHELAGTEDKQAAIENWWKAYPELRGRRWYSVALGKKVYLLNVDSTSALTPGSEQRNWIEDQVAHLDPAVEFVFVALHHPPVADIQMHLEVDHNPRPNEISLRDYLSAAASKSHAHFIVTAGHIHNYERFETGGVVYLVSGGGGARPYFVERTKPDLYQDENFPNFHYIRFTLVGSEMKATMYRLSDVTAAKPEWQAKDTFSIRAK